MVRRCLEKNRAERFESARDLAFALREAGSLSIPPREPTAPARQRIPRLPAWSLALLGALALLAVLLIIGDVGGLRRRLSGGGTAARIDSLAVLPLANLSGDPAQEYFADGMTEELISAASRRLESLKVISRTSVMRFKGAAPAQAGDRAASWTSTPWSKARCSAPATGCASPRS